MIKLRNKWLQPCPVVPGIQLDPRQVSAKQILSKYIQFSSPLLNRGTIYLADDPQICVAKEGTCLRPGSNYIIDVDVNRDVALDLQDFYFAGDYAGDKLVVSYLQEEDDGNN